MNKASGNSSETKQRRPLLEVIACSVADAIAAEAGGADRLEIISHFEVGGLTPPLELVREITAAVRIPVRVMLRESENFQVDDDAERRRLWELAAEMDALRTDGIVCGFLRDGGIDHGLLARVLACAPHTKATFHRAFEELRDPIAAISQLKKYPQADRILTSGGSGNLRQKVDCLDRCARAAGPEITILAGGGMTDDFIRELREKTSIREFHVGTFVRVPAAASGAVSAERVRDLINACLS
ncbi:MAG TPA: copper homeostasis protein CutC [Blastocatellia bacterium]|nr:copper homeostasis protein CutC [Blastocatellia bacterium]